MDVYRRIKALEGELPKFFLTLYKNEQGNPHRLYKHNRYTLSILENIDSGVTTYTLYDGLDNTHKIKSHNVYFEEFKEALLKRFLKGSDKNDV